METLLKNIKAHLPELEALQTEIAQEFCYEDHVYRYYHNSYKVFYTQSSIKKMVEMFKKVMPEYELNQMFMNIVEDGLKDSWKFEHNKNWDKVTRPIVEALFHCKYMLDMMVKYGKELNKAPQLLPTGWASVLYLYGLR
jgi:hypothetical protein